MKADIWGDPQDKEKISKQFAIIEQTRDFLEWLFEHSGEIDHISQSEAWDKFEKWQVENEPE